MPLADQFAGAIERAQFSDLNDLAHKLWKAHAAGHLDDETAQRLAEQLEARRPARRGLLDSNKVTSFRPARAAPKRQRSPDKQASIERRRRLARASPVPPEFVHEFSVSEHAVITIMVDQIRVHGVCSLCNAAIAALAGTCVTIVRYTNRKARALGLLYREERRRRGQKSLTNLVRILRPSWRRWVLWVGRKKTRTTTDKDPRIDRTTSVDRSVKRSSEGGFARSAPRGGP